MQFDLTILGNNAAIPAHNRHPSAQIVNHNSSLFLIDCGEGTQFQMNRFGVKRGKLDHIFITHLHGDHYFGLIGLLTSFNLNWREHPLHIYAPPALEEIIRIHFKHSKTELKFEIHFHSVDAENPKTIFDDAVLTVTTIPLTHRLPTTGFLFREKPHQRKIIAEKIQQYNIPYSAINNIKNGSDFVDTTDVCIPNSELTLPPAASRSFAYCSDTVYTTHYIEQLKGVDMLYHEATFMHEHEERAKETYHTTTKQAALVARDTGVGKLIIGHFSARYENLQVLLDESREIFSNTHLAEEGKTFSITQK